MLYKLNSESFLHRISARRVVLKHYWSVSTPPILTKRRRKKTTTSSRGIIAFIVKGLVGSLHIARATKSCSPNQATITMLKFVWNRWVSGEKTHNYKVNFTHGQDVNFSTH